MSAVPVDLSGFEPLPPDSRTFKPVPMRFLTINPELQRQVRVERAEQIANELDWRKFEVLTVVPLEKGYFRVVEGQTRFTALQKRGFKGEVMCAVLPRLTVEDEADVALGIAKGRASHTKYETWRLCVNRGDERERGAEDVLRKFHLRVGTAATMRTLACIGVVSYTIHAHHKSYEAGMQLLNDMLSVITCAFPENRPDSATRWDGRLVRAVVEVIERNPHVDLVRLAEALETRLSIQWISEAQMHGNRPPWAPIGVELVGRYNKYMRSTDRMLGW